MNDKEISQKAKEYLSQINSVDRLINRLTSTVCTLRSSLISQNYQLNPNKVQTSGPKDRLAETMAKIVDLEADINRRIDDLVELKRDTMRFIEILPELNQQNVLIGRYIENRKWFEIAEEMNYSISQVYKIHGQALLAFGKISLNL